MKKIDIVSHKKPIFFLTCLFLFISFAILIFIPFNKSIEFIGGFVFEVSGEIKMESISQISEKSQIYSSSARHIIKIPYLQRETLESIQGKIAQNHKIKSASMVAPSMTSSLIQKSIIAVTLSVLTIFLYLFLRFNIYYSIGSILTITHDIILSVAFIKVMNIEISITTIAALLTIIGYSVNDTVIIYDKIRSYFHIKSSLSGVINTSINETLPRTINTSLTTVLSIFPVALLTSGQIHDFAIVVIFGIFIGTISSIAVSALSLLPFEKQIHSILQIKHKLTKLPN